MSRKKLARFDDVELLEQDDPLPGADVFPPSDGGVTIDAEELRPMSSPVRSPARREPETAEQTALIRRVWGDTMLGDPLKVSAIVRTQGVLAEESGRMLRSALNIGRSLIEMKTVLGVQDFARGLRRSAEAFRGWSSSNISKVMSVAEFVDETEMQLTSMPQHYSVLYEFTTLNDTQLQTAKSLALFRPDVKRSDIQEFKKSVVGSSKPPKPQSPKLLRINEEIRTLQARLAKARRERTRIIASGE